MNIEKLFLKNTLQGASGLFYATGSFGVCDKYASYDVTNTPTGVCYSQNINGVTLSATFEERQNGVIIRKDSLTNNSKKTVTVNGCQSRFYLSANEYEVYTQYNSWQHESSGQWQKLVTECSAKNTGIRSCDGATPMMALHNLYTGKNAVFHILPTCKWCITAKRFPYNKSEFVVVQTGFDSENLNITVDIGESIELPTVIFFYADSKTDLDAYKLHTVFNELYPRKAMPVLYNSWLYCFDILNPENLYKQAEAAYELGFEAFMIDAGWFGNGENWSLEVGDWEENENLGFDGGITAFSEFVRKMGMLFGLWFEPERAGVNSKLRLNHPEFLIDDYLFDFSKKEAVEYMIETICSAIEKYSIGWLKFDFNDTIHIDKSSRGFYEYYKGQRRFITAIKERFPNIYITNCASGGYRMELNQATMTDSFWLSDNQSSVKGIEILKNTIKRLPPCVIERWNVQKFCEGFTKHGEKEKSGILVTVNDALWSNVISVNSDYTKGFLTGGVIGFSCDLYELEQKIKDDYKEFIKLYKEERDFYKNAVCRILVDSPQITVLQYSDPSLKKIVLQVFSSEVYAYDLTVYPVVNPEVEYSVDGQTVKGKLLINEGIYFEKLEDYSCQTKILKTL
ncbi:MAG: glycoside hydrolase family 36 protein [Acutalibacteraceae bacterium]|nr:glycoside hydrolase family 36 protein [Acutalibacteraceae bacterium]